ncbi:protein-tyrosine phosphatase-like protein [Schizophyllum fasciatum]
MCVEVSAMHAPSALCLPPPSLHLGPRADWPLSPSPMTAAPSLPPPPPGTKRPCPGAASQILPNLFVSDLAFAESAPCLAAAGITHVLSVLPEPISIPAAAAGRRIQRKQVRIEDSPFAELAAHLPAMVRFIEDALAGPPAVVLVHCAEGVSRSVAVAAAYLVKAHGRSPMDALRHIAARRRVARPNFGFVQQLHEYARDHLGRDVAVPSADAIERAASEEAPWTGAAAIVPADTHPRSAAPRLQETRLLAAPRRTST